MKEKSVFKTAVHYVLRAVLFLSLFLSYVSDLCCARNDNGFVDYGVVHLDGDDDPRLEHGQNAVRVVPVTLQLSRKIRDDKSALITKYSFSLTIFNYSFLVL